MKRDMSFIDSLKEGNLASLKVAMEITLFCFLMTLSAQVRIPLPFTPVPLTLQVLAVFLCGYFLRPKSASLSMILYLSMGLLGAPVFSGWGSGWSSLIGPTGGYIMGFIPAVWLISFCSHSKIKMRRKFLIPLTSLAGITTIYFFGLWNLMAYLYFSMGISGSKLIILSFQLGVFPFIAADIIKAAIAALIYYGLYQG